MPVLLWPCVESGRGRHRELRAGLVRYLQKAGIDVIEIDRHNRQARRWNGKSDPLDAVEAARAAPSGRARALAKSRDGRVEAIRALLVAQRSTGWIRSWLPS